MLANPLKNRGGPFRHQLVECGNPTSRCALTVSPKSLRTLSGEPRGRGRASGPSGSTRGAMESGPASPRSPFGGKIGWFNEWGASLPREQQDRPWTSLAGSSSRTVWGAGELEESPRPPSRMFSSLGEREPSHQRMWQQSLYVPYGRGPDPGWADRLPSPLASTLGTKTGRPLTAFEKSGKLWGTESQRLSCRPPAHDPIHGRHPDQVPIVEYTTTASQLGKSARESTANNPVFGKNTPRCQLGYEHPSRPTTERARPKYTLGSDPRYRSAGTQPLDSGIASAPA
jgi:hypothetical protein